jgi:hypothetical protein
MQEALTNTPRWSIARRVTVLFFTVYFFFLVFDFTSSDELFPHFVYVLFSPLTSLWHWLVPWTGENVLHLSYPITVRPNGSGDTTYNYVLQMLWLVFSFVIALIWAVADRKRPSYNQLYNGLRISVRYYFAFILFVYGFIKIIKLQFPFPDLTRMADPFGSASPMGLAWSFIGYSEGYNFFIGAAEVIAGVLILFRRTVLIGSLIAMTVMINVAAMNFMYDIPVKIFSSNLILLSAFLAAHEFDRLRKFFFLNKPVAPSPASMRKWPRWATITRVVAKSAFILFALYSTLWTYYSQSREYGDKAPKPPLYGIYNVESFTRNSTELPPLLTDTTRWKQLIVSFRGRIRIANMADSTRWMKFEVDTARHTAVLTSFRDSTDRYAFNYVEPDKDHLLFTGIGKRDTLQVKLKRFDLMKFRLVSRGFNWINEYPYNR